MWEVSTPWPPGCSRFAWARQPRSPGTSCPGGPQRQKMADAGAIDFWKSVAARYKDRPYVAFDLFNEPWPDNAADTTAAWTCWLNGGCVQPSRNGPDSYPAVGMQQLVNTVRAAGAGNIVIALETTDC